MLQLPLLVAAAALTLLVLKRYAEYRAAVRSIQDHPGFRTLLSAFGIATYTLVTRAVPGVTTGPSPNWRRKYTDFVYFGVDVISHVSVFPTVRQNFYIADPAIIKEITSDRTRFPKPIAEYAIVAFFGRNIVASEGAEWKRFRGVAAPAFSEPNTRLVWDETARVLAGLMEDVWGGQDTVVVDHIVDLTLQIAMFVIGAAGFGRRVSWAQDALPPPGHALTFKDALTGAIKGIFPKLVFPDWALRNSPSARMRHAARAYDELEKYMLEMIHARRTAEKREARHDLFAGLLDASDEDTDGTTRLSDEELLGNVFIFLIGGHETTAHLLAFALALLALHQDEQEKLYEHVKGVVKDKPQPTYEDSHALTRVMAVIYETLRLFPPATRLPKIAAEDTTLTTVDATGARVVVPVPKGSRLEFQVPGLHYNPRYWPDPYAFVPDRFLGDWPRDAFITFSSGARACLGRRFSETEATAVLSTLVLRYKISIKEEPQFAHETFEQRRARILEAKEELTMSPIRVPLVFTRRQ